MNLLFRVSPFSISRRNTKEELLRGAAPLIRFSGASAYFIADFDGGAVGCSSRHNTSPTPREIVLQEKVTVPGIKEFGKIDEFIYRGAQPKPEGIDELKKLGIDVIIDLRGERAGLRKKEQEYAEALGMKLINLPGYGWASSKDEEVAQFFPLVRETPRKKSLSIAGWAETATAFSSQRIASLSTAEPRNMLYRRCAPFTSMNFGIPI